MLTVKVGGCRCERGKLPDIWKAKVAVTAASVTTGISRSSSGRNNWARPAGRKMAPILPRHKEHQDSDIVGYWDGDDDKSSDSGWVDNFPGHSRNQADKQMIRELPRCARQNH